MNGNYQININSETLYSYKLIIKDSLFVENHKGDTISGKIKWLNNNTFELIRDKKSEQKLKELERKLQDSFGNYCYEINSKSNNRYSLRITYSIRRDIIVNVGEIIKQEIEKLKL